MLITLMEADVEVVRGIIDALNRGDIDGMLARMAPDFEWKPLEASPVARVYRGREQVRRYVEDWRAAFDSLRLELQEPTEVGGSHRGGRTWTRPGTRKRRGARDTLLSGVDAAPPYGGRYGGVRDS